MVIPGDWVKYARWYNASVNSLLSDLEWEAYLSEHPDAHLLQTSQWGDLKATYGWAIERIKVGDCGAQVLFYRFPLGITLAYIPKGPIGDWLPIFLPQLDALCRQHRTFALKIEPDNDYETTLVDRLTSHDFSYSPHSIQPRQTLIVDLRGEEDEILARMHQKTRYNIRLASRKGVIVRPWDDLVSFGQMIQQTAVRDGFDAHTPTYYTKAFNLFHPLGACETFVAEYEGQILATLMVFIRGKRAWYFYGASTIHHRNLMPNYLLQWEAMRWARNQGCTQYDLWGVPDEEEKKLESEFTTRRDNLWGVYRFKRGFGGKLVRSVGAWDRTYNRTIYKIYHWIMSLRSN